MMVKTMGWSVYAKGANSAMNSETRKQTLATYISKHTAANFNVQDCYNHVFKKQDVSDKKNMKSIATLHTYLKEVLKQNDGVMTPTLDRALTETKLLKNMRAKRVAEAKELKDDYRERYGIVIGDKNLD